MKITLERAKRFLDSGYSLLTVGNNKMPNFSWKENQKTALSKNEFEKRYNYNGGIFKKDGTELPATSGAGYITGYNNIEVLDFDLKIFESLKKQQDFWNEFLLFAKDNIDDFDEKFVIYKTVNNGYHIIYRCEKVDGNKKIAVLKDYKQAVIESRGVGGYAFVYENQVSKLDYLNIKEISIHDRDALWGCCRYYNYEKKQPEQNVSTKNLDKKFKQDLKTWDDYNNKTKVLDLVEDEFDIVKRLSDKTVIKRHGAESAHSGYIYHNVNVEMMMLFSTGTSYPAEIGLTPFSIYTHRYHNGNYGNAALDLYKKGFGSRIVVEVESLSSEIKIDKSKLDFPIDIFPLRIQNYFLECSKKLDSSIDYMGVSLLWLISVSIGNTFKIKVKTGWIESCSVWVSIIGKAGIGKTPSISNVIFPLIKKNNTEIKHYIKQYQKYEAYKALSEDEKKNHEEIKKPYKSQFIVNDITQEALIELHEENKNSIGVFKDELAGWFKDMNKYRAGSDLEFWLSSWSNKGINLNRKTAKSSFVESPIIPVLGGIQPSILTQFFTDENKDNGFIDRMLVSFPEMSIDYYNSNELSEEVLQWYSDFIITFFETVSKTTVFNEDMEINSHIIPMDDEANKEWKRIFNNITKTQNSDEENEYMKSMLPKQKSYIPRFALLLHIFDQFDKQTIDVSFVNKDAMLKAEKLSNYFINMAKKIKIDSSIKNDMVKIVNKNQDLTNKEKCLAMVKSNPDYSKSEIAEILGISRQQVYNYLK